jgi:hypothetical protein
MCRLKLTRNRKSLDPVINAIKRTVQQEFARERLGTAGRRSKSLGPSRLRKTRFGCRSRFCSRQSLILTLRKKTDELHQEQPRSWLRIRCHSSGTGPIFSASDRLARLQNGKLINASRELLRYLDGQNLPATIIPTGRTCGVATDSATALRTLGQLRGVPAVSGFSRPKSHLGRFSFWYTHWLILLS